MIMKSIRMYLTVFLVLAVSACQERTPAHFADIAGVYFNNLSLTMSVTDSLDMTFVYESSDSLSVPVVIQLLGRPAGQDRQIEVNVSSDNAVEGADYLLPDLCVLPSGASSMEYVVTLLRTESLKKEKKNITLELSENEFFSLPVSKMDQIADTVSILRLDIAFSDMFTKSPVAWDSNLVGEFSQQKFVLLCKVLEIDPADFQDASVITLAKLLYISAEMTAYVEEQVSRKAEGLEYDLDAFDPVTGEPLSFRR